MAAISFDVLTGQSGAHLVPSWSGALVHADVLQPLQELRRRASQSGIELAVASSFRSFDRQLLIWREKVSGKRTLTGVDGSPLSVEDSTPRQALDALLRWSALPGLSRHHWGTDLDVYDAAAIDDNYRLQLVPGEYAPNGPFAALDDWLTAHIDSRDCCGFYRPYAVDLGGVAPEPWHISYRPLAEQFAQCVNFDLFQRLLDEAGWPLQAEIRDRAEEIYRCYVCNSGVGSGSVGV